MRLTTAALLAAGALCLPMGVIAKDYPSPSNQTTCTSRSVTADVPSGVYVDKNGRRWVGFNPNGTPPDSLAKDSQSVTCAEQKADEPSSQMPPNYPPNQPGPQ